MRSDETLHPGHKSLRLPYRDYATAGIYYVTICASDRRCILARIENATANLTRLGEIARECWVQIPTHFPRVAIHAFTIMPNHLHTLIELKPSLGPKKPETIRREFDATSVPSGSLSAIIRSFKAIVTRRAKRELQFDGDVWERNYFEHAVRNGDQFAKASQYIIENPMKWEQDKENPGLPRFSDHAKLGRSGAGPYMTSNDHATD
jgi:putative transposase